MFEILSQCHAPEMRGLLEKSGLLNIEAVSQREFDWYEAPNKRRGGWSGVSRIVLNPESAHKEQKAVFLKIQQNHFYTSWRNAFRKRLSYQREYHALRSLAGQFDCIPHLLLFAEWRNDKDHGCLIVTEALDGWTCLKDWLSSGPEEKRIAMILEKLAYLLRRMHLMRWAHYGLFQKHIFLRFDGAQPEIKLIDFEKARKCLTRRHCLLEDVSRFLRHSKNLTETQKRHFLEAYFDTRPLQPEQRKLIRKMKGVQKLAQESLEADPSS